MNVVALMATIILIATLATLIFAFASYFVTKAKRKRAKKTPVLQPDKTDTTRTYFERYNPVGTIKSINKSTITETADTNQWT